MTRKQSGIVFSVGLCAYVALMILASLARPVGEFDDSIPLVFGRLIRDGLTPHGDFSSLYPPLDFYATALAFTLVGETVLAQRLLHALLWPVILLFAWRMHRRLLGESSDAALVLLPFAVACGPIFLLSPWMAYALALSALLAFAAGAAGRDHPEKRSVILAGALAGLALVTRVNLGGYAVAAILASILLDLPRAVAQQGWRAALCRGVETAAALIAPVVACVTACLLPYGGNAGAVLEQTLWFPAWLMPTHRFIDLPVNPWICYALAFPPAWFAVRHLLSGGRASSLAFPLVASVLLVSYALWNRTEPGVARNLLALEYGAVASLHIGFRRLGRAELPLLLFYCGLIHYGFSRADGEHFMHLLPAAFLLLPFPLTSGLAADLPRRLLVVVVLAVVAAMLGWECFRPLVPQVRASIALVLHGRWEKRISDADRMASGGVTGGVWSSLYPDGDQIQAVRFVRQQTAPQEAVFAGVSDHSSLFANNVRTYWLLDRPIPSRYVVFEPGLVTELAAQERMVSDLEARGVRWVITQRFAEGDETFRRRAYKASTYLDDYLAGHFCLSAEFGSFRILRRCR